MEKERQRSAKGQMVALMQAGHPWQEAAAMAGVRIGRSAAYQIDLPEQIVDLVLHGVEVP